VITRTALALLLYAAALAAAFAGGAAAQSFDLIIEGARIVDGAGNPWYRGDVGVRGDRIAEIGNLSGRTGRRISARGHVVAPGFIDLMGADSFPLLLDPASGISKLAQGITTMLAGEGESTAPQSDATIAGLVRKFHIAGTRSRSTSGCWSRAACRSMS